MMAAADSGSTDSFDYPAIGGGFATESEAHTGHQRRC